MALVAAKCPQCGANLNVDETKDACVCEYCGTPFITEKAINNYNISITNQNNFDGATINVSAIEQNNDNLMELAKLANQSGKRDEALQYIDKILATDIGYVDAWLYKARSLCIGDEMYLCFLNASKYAKNEADKKAYKLEYFEYRLSRLLNHTNVMPYAPYYHQILPTGKITGKAWVDIQDDKEIQDLIIKRAAEAREKRIKEWGDTSQIAHPDMTLKDNIIHMNLAFEECRNLLPDNRKDEIQLLETYKIPPEVAEANALKSKSILSIAIICSILATILVFKSMENSGASGIAFLGCLLLLIGTPIVTFIVVLIIADAIID